MSKLLIPAALATAGAVILSYVGFFYFKLRYGFSHDPAVWGQLGDYVGGLLNPILSFISVVLLIRSLALQNAANRVVVDQIQDAKKSERLRSFESQLFNMLESQKSAFESLMLNERLKKGHKKKFGSDAVLVLESKIRSLRGKNKSDKEIKEILWEIDSRDQIFGAARRFYIMVQMVNEKLDEVNGFTKADRVLHIKTLINFTDFSLLRLIMITLQFMEFQSSFYLRESAEFNEALKDVCLSYDLY